MAKKQHVFTCALFFSFNRKNYLKKDFLQSKERTNEKYECQTNANDTCIKDFSTRIEQR